jgi:magnesium transporter
MQPLPPPPPTNPGQSSSALQSAETIIPPAAEGKKKRKHRGGKKRRNRRQSFAAPPSEASARPSITDATDDPLIEESSQPSFYKLGPSTLSRDSLDSEALLDHRTQPSIRPRRESRLNPNVFSQSYLGGSFPRPDNGTRRSYRSHQDLPSPGAEPDEEDVSDHTPLLLGGSQHKSPVDAGYGLFRTKSNTSTLSATSRKQKKRTNGTVTSVPRSDPTYDVNNPPSVPASPNFGPQYGDVMVDDGNFLPRSPDSRRNLPAAARDTLIDIDGDGEGGSNSAPPSPRLRPEGIQRHRTMTLPVEGDVCFPGDEAASEVADDYFERMRPNGRDSGVSRRRRREREWPQVWVLDEWAHHEKEARAGERRAKKISEPVFVNGRLRAPKNTWHRVEGDVQYRYTYFNEEFESTIHSESISELVQPGSSFRELFIPDPPELSESSSSEDEEHLDKQKDALLSAMQSPKSQIGQLDGPAGISTLSSKIKINSDPSGKDSERNSGSATPQNKQTPPRTSKTKKYGPRPTFWLDVLCPTDQEMRVLCKAFGIHALTSEDVMLQEAREKVELFRNYYFINYRTFEQDTQSEDYLEPINMYVCVFRYGIITFHFSQIPHPANVRRRIRQLSDYLILSADWISYAIIDDITDVYQPLITSIEEEVDDIDDLILKYFSKTNELGGAEKDHRDPNNEKDPDAGETSSGMEMLIRIGKCRKKVMSLYRLLGNKADVIKGFAKRCNEQWEVAPKSEIGLYLGDIQDHILTMTGNLSHYETLLGRAHNNYLAQVSINMNERQEKVGTLFDQYVAHFSFSH